MFSLFRSGTSQKVMLAILGVSLFAIVITGFGTGGGGLGGLGLGSDTIAEVEGEPIRANEMTEQMNRQLTRAREQQPALDMGTFLRGGAFEEILRQLISMKAIVAFARDEGLGVSKRMIDGEIASIAAFQNLAGKFDETTFRNALRAEGVTEQQLRDDLAATLLQRHIVLPAAGSARVPEGLAFQYASLLLEQRSGTVGLVPAQAFAAGPAPTDAELANFYQANRGRYTIPERRVLRYVEFGPEQVAAAAQPTDAEIAAAYQGNQAKYGAKQTRNLQQVVLPDQAAARAFMAQVAKGTSFVQAAAEAGFNTNDIAVGDQSREQFAGLTSPAIATAAFSAKQGDIIQPQQSAFGWHVVRVEAINSKPATPLAAVRNELVQALAKQKQEQAIGALVTKIEDAIADGSTMEEVARAEKLTVRETPPITASGIQFDNPAFRAPELAPVLKTAFEMEADEEPVVETLVPGQRYALLAVSRIVPAAPPPLANIRGQVRADFIAKRASDRARTIANAIVAKINAGRPVREAYSEAGVPLPAPQSVSARRLDIARPGQPVPPPLAMLFSLPKGKAKILEAPNRGGWFVVHLDNSLAGDAANAPGLVQATRSQFQRIIGDEYAAQLSRAIENSIDVERNDAAIERTKKTLAGSDAF